MPLKDLFLFYLDAVRNFRDDHMDVSNLEFHKTHELRIKVPLQWKVRECLVNSLKEKSFSSVFVFYSDTPSYRSFYDLVREDEVNFCSYFELQCAIMNSTQDIRPQQRIQSEIGSASVVIVLDSSRCSEIVLNAIRQFTNGSLILID